MTSFISRIKLIYSTMKNKKGLYETLDANQINKLNTKFYAAFE